MAAIAVLGGLWRRFRALALWVQLSVGLAAGVIVVSPFTSEAQPNAGVAAPSTTTTAGEELAVVRVIDGDTIVVSGDIHVRLIGVDTPETSAAVDCFGPEATRYLNELLPVGTSVRLDYDVERLDRYGRTLAYVYKLSDGVFVNLAVARNGFAVQLTVAPNVAHAEEFRAAVAEARSADLGLWRSCRTTTTVPVPVTPAPTVAVVAAPTTTKVTAAPTTAAPTTVARVTTTTAAPAAGGACHPSYAGACVPTGFSDVDCAGGGGNGPGYVSGKNFQVVGPDVYGLDSDGDGIACESR
jgi:endonuclease YncB( thermonuclease family)